MQNGGNDAKIKPSLSKSSPFEVKMLVEFIRRGISVLGLFMHCAQNFRLTFSLCDQLKTALLLTPKAVSVSEFQPTVRSKLPR